MLKEKDDKQSDKKEALADGEDGAFASHKARLHALIDGELSETEGLAYLRLISGGPERLTASIYRATIAAVKAYAIADTQKLFAGQGKLIDCCGTGGSGLAHYNTSTTVAFVLAAAGLKVAKFGNRAASNRSGSFDLLDKLGVGAILPVESISDRLEKTNLAFLFAPQFYPALATIAPLRKAIGQPTVFNYIGPLLNPADPVFRVIGVPNKHVQSLAASLLQDQAKIEDAFVITAESGLDELDVNATNNLVRIAAGKNGGKHTIKSEIYERLQSQKFDGMFEGLLSADENLKIFQALISGEIGPGHYYHAIVCLNAAASLRVSGLVDNLDDGFAAAAKLLQDGAVKAKFEQYQSQFK